jgi:membrane fusion protein, multidrug efflux system
MKTALSLLAGLIIGIAVAWAFLHHGEHGEKAAESEHKEESHVQHGTIARATQEHIGLKTAPVEAVQWRPEAKGYGQVMDPTPLTTLLVDQLSAKVALDVSSKEYERLKALYAQDQNVSMRALETAEAAMRKDEILLQAANAKLSLTLGSTASGQPNLQAFVDSLVSLKQSLVRVDLPLGQSLEKPPEGGQVAALAAPEHPLPAKFLGPAPVADPQTQGQGFLFLLETNPLPPGTAVIGWLQIPGDSLSGVIIPRAALVRHEGETLVYIQTGDETFEHREIELERPTEKGWFVHKGMARNDKVVIAGAQQLLAEEFKASDAE